MKLPRVFLLSLAAGIFGVLLLAGVSRFDSGAPPAPSPVSKSLLDGVAVREQIGLADVARIRAEGYRTLIDLRPDGEAPGQPPAAAVREAAEKAGLTFAYIPTPNGAIPQSRPEELARVLANSDKPVLLYCRSGSRAARVWALAEAARTDGAPASAIAAAVRAAGQKVDDLLPQIDTLVAQRAR